MEPSEFPMRINKYLALKKYATRRGADEIIKKKQFFINGRLAVLGDKVQAKDVVEVKFRGKPTPLAYIAYHKPRGVVADSVFEGKEIFAVNGLDKEAHGLIIFTNDGRVHVREREYVVVAKKPLRASFKAKMEASGPCTVKVLSANTFRITISGENRFPIRQACAVLFQEVKDMQCIRVVNIRLGNLPEGESRNLEEKELRTFMEQ
jgi:23S rRNA pseudouridine2604 synthase